MPAFTNKSLRPSPLLAFIRRYPFLTFGLPFISIMVGSSFLLEGFTQTKYDYHSQRVHAVSFEEERGMAKNRKKVDIREEYYRLTNPEYAAQQDALAAAAAAHTPSALDLQALTSKPAEDTAAKQPKKKKFSFVPIPQDELENVRVSRPEGVPEWGFVEGAEQDMPVKGKRKEDRWV